MVGQRVGKVGSECHVGLIESRKYGNRIADFFVTNKESQMDYGVPHSTLHIIKGVRHNV